MLEVGAVEHRADLVDGDGGRPPDELGEGAPERFERALDQVVADRHGRTLPRPRRRRRRRPGRSAQARGTSVG